MNRPVWDLHRRRPWNSRITTLTTLRRSAHPRNQSSPSLMKAQPVRRVLHQTIILRLRAISWLNSWSRTLKTKINLLDTPQLKKIRSNNLKQQSERAIYCLLRQKNSKSVRERHYSNHTSAWAPHLLLVQAKSASAETHSKVTHIKARTMCQRHHELV